MEPIAAYCLTHGHLKPVFHPDLRTEITGETVVKYLRFAQVVTVQKLELPRIVTGRWVPAVPSHPASLHVSTWNEENSSWQLQRTQEWPAYERLSGKGLSQDATVEEMAAYLGSKEGDEPLIIEFDPPLETDHLRLECDREHPVWPNHGEVNGGPFHVPFGILDHVSVQGEKPAGAKTLPVYRPILKLTGMNPAAPAGMEIIQESDRITFKGESLQVAFSLRRPLLLHLGWDSEGEGQSSANRLLTSRGMSRGVGQMSGLSGPLVKTLQGDYGAHMWSGEVSVEGNRVCYRNLSAIEGLKLDVTFTIEADSFRIDLVQHCDRDLSILEWEGWRLAWDLTAGSTACVGLPSESAGRNGRVAFPAMLATDGVGCLSVEASDQKLARLQVESYRSAIAATVGFTLVQDGHHLTIPQGTNSLTVNLKLANFTPVGLENGQSSKAVQRHWATIFSCFRSEHRGFSNNASSCNCHLSQMVPIDLACHTQAPPVGPDPVELGRFTIARALLDGGGYGYHRNLYLDSDPVLISAAGRLHQTRPDHTWLKKIEPGLRAAIHRMTSTLRSDGLAVCADLSGNSASYRWSCNGMDVVGFGHLDAYVNALTYRALRNASALLLALGNPAEARSLSQKAHDLRKAFPVELLNPETGWIAGWKSRDGKLHDYAFLWINGIAIAFGLLDPIPARQALVRLEELRHRVGPGDARLGLPFNLLPIGAEDHMLPSILGLLQPSFETYTDGGLSAAAAPYYLRALSLYGLQEEAETLAKDLESGYVAGKFNGGVGTGVEFCSWEGSASGYEGTLGGCFGALYGIAIQRGLVQPAQPEWWPEQKESASA